MSDDENQHANDNHEAASWDSDLDISLDERLARIAPTKTKPARSAPPVRTWDDMMRDWKLAIAAGDERAMRRARERLEHAAGIAPHNPPAHRH